MQVKMICGTYGLWNGSGITLKSPKDPPFDLPREDALRLITLGRAKAVGDDPGPEGLEGPPGYDRSMKFAQLQEVARYYGLNTEGLRSKGELIEAIERKIGGGNEDGGEIADDGEEPPKVSVAPPAV